MASIFGARHAVPQAIIRRPVTGASSAASLLRPANGSGGGGAVEEALHPLCTHSKLLALQVNRLVGAPGGASAEDAGQSAASASSARARRAIELKG